MSASPSPFDAFDLPPVWPEALLPEISARNTSTETRLVVFDDDPLGGQCVRDLPVLTTWEPARLAEEIEHTPAFLLLTNTRSLPRAEAIERAGKVGTALRRAEEYSRRRITPVWRSDSTLRGHYYWEMQAFESAFRGDNAREPVFVFLPYFGDGGRYTLNNTQYVWQPPDLVPVATTEFARDPSYAYEHSHLPRWLEAHSNGRFPAAETTCVGLEDLRVGGPEHVASRLTSTAPGSAVIVNAADDRDLEVFVAGLQPVEGTDLRFLCSGAASFVRVRTGMAPCPLLSTKDLDLSGDAGGLVIVASYVDKTTAQLDHVLAHPSTAGVELDVAALSAAPARRRETGRVAGLLSKHLAEGDDVVLYTSRGYLDGASSLVADALTELIDALEVRPRYLLAKGGSTASHLATACLGVQRAMVLGQLLPGVPVWRLGEESRWPGLPFVIFAGNVGTPESLAEALHSLRGS